MLIIDAKEHSIFGHMASSNYLYALEFTVPLLLECGYTADAEILESHYENMPMQ